MLQLWHDQGILPAVTQQEERQAPQGLALQPHRWQHENMTWCRPSSASSITTDRMMLHARGHVRLAEMLGRELQDAAVIAQALRIPQHLLHPQPTRHVHHVQGAWTQT